jgi:hypothetical protein
MPTRDFYTDHAAANFGASIATEAGEILATVDGKLKVTQWLNGPGNLEVIRQPWAQAGKSFAWVEQFAALRPRVTGKGELERFDYWLATFRATAAMIEIGCLRHELDQAVALMKTNGAQPALDARVALARCWERLMRHVIQTVSSPGELGTIANLEMRNLKYSRFVDAHDAALQKALGSTLPPETTITKSIDANPRVALLTTRDQVAIGETLLLPIIALGQTPMDSVTVKWRPLGHGEWTTLAAKHVARAVYSATLPPATHDIEYHLEAKTSSGKILRLPASAPDLNHTVIVRE